MRFIVYLLAWLICNMMVGACIAGLTAILVFYTAIGPFACIYVGARLGVWCDLGFSLTSILMMGGLWLFGEVRITLYRHVLRWWRGGFCLLGRANALRDDLWRQYWEKEAQS